MKAYYNKSQIENIVSLLLSVAQHISKQDNEELVNETKEFMLRTDRPLEIVLEVLIKVKSNDQNNKISNTETIENAELVTFIHSPLFFLGKHSINHYSWTYKN